MSSKDYVSVLPRQSAPEGVDWRTMSVVARALLLTRASVLPLTILGSGQGLLFAWWSGKISGVEFGGNEVSGILLGFAAFFGANLAHAANNLANDWRDYHDGLDRPGYPRADYSPHPIASGAMSSRTLLITIGVLTALAAIFGGFTMVIRGEPLWIRQLVTKGLPVDTNPKCERGHRSTSPSFTLRVGVSHAVKQSCSENPHPPAK